MLKVGGEGSEDDSTSGWECERTIYKELTCCK